MNKAQKQMAQQIKTLLETNDAALVVGVKRIYDRQTTDEQRSYSTVHNNKRGFTGLDAEFLTSIAKQIGDGKIVAVKHIVSARTNKPTLEIQKDSGVSYLSMKQVTTARKMMTKYAGQLVLVAEEKAARQAVQ